MISTEPPGRARRYLTGLDRAADGLAGDLVLYALATAFALLTARTSTLAPHRAWGGTATLGYLVATLLVIGQLLLRHRRAGRSRTASAKTTTPLTGTAARAAITALTWVTTTCVPLVQQAAQRAAGRLDRAQEEVEVVERSGRRLLDTGTPYLGHDAIAALPADERLLGYTPYQPGMSLFGLPRAAAGTAWWTDARIWFALATAVCLLLAVRAIRAPRDHPPSAADPRRDPALVRAVQLATVLPVCALTLATGGDDLPVLALCLLALALCATGRHVPAGLTAGLAAALKLFAWPVALVLAVLALVQGRRPGLRYAVPALVLPVGALLPAHLVDPDALVENVLRFPLGQGLVTSPAQSPLPGHLIAAALPAGRIVAAALLVATGLVIAVHLLRRPPHTAATAALICGYGLLAAIALMPSTRFGYLLYPVALLAWVPALRHAGRAPGPELFPGDRTEQLTLRGAATRTTEPA